MIDRRSVELIVPLLRDVRPCPELKPLPDPKISPHELMLLCLEFEETP